MRNKEKKMNWYNVTLRQFLMLQELFKVEDENERVIAIAELLLGDNVTSLPLPEFMDKVKKLSFLKEALPENNPPKKVEVNGRKYYMDCLLGNVSTAQYVDYTNFSNTNDICKMMAVFLIPEGHKYNDGYDMEQVFQDVNDLPIPIVNSAAFFFAKQFKTFMRIFQRYSTKQLKKTNLPKEAKESMIEVVNKSVDMALFPLS